MFYERMPVFSSALATPIPMEQVAMLELSGLIPRTTSTLRLTQEMYSYTDEL